MNFRTLSLAFIAATLAACGAQPNTSSEAATTTQVETISEIEKSQLLSQLEAIKYGLTSGDEQQVINALAPSQMRRASGLGLGVAEVDLPAFEIELIKQMKDLLSQAEFTSVNFDTEGIDYLKTETNEPVAYIPAEVNLSIEGVSLRSFGNYVAVRRSEDWIVLSPSDDAAVENLKRAFPELKGQTIPAMQIEVIG